MKIGILFLGVLRDRRGRQVCKIHHEVITDMNTYFITCIYMRVKQKMALSG